MSKYKTLLDKHNEDIRGSYAKAASNVIALNGISDARKEWASRVIEHKSSFKVSRDPILIVGGFDADQKRGSAWAPHLNRLREALGKDRVIAAGDAKSVNLAPGRLPGMA